MKRFEQREAPILAAAPEPMDEDRADVCTRAFAEPIIYGRQDEWQLLKP